MPANVTFKVIWQGHNADMHYRVLRDDDGAMIYQSKNTTGEGPKIWITLTSELSMSGVLLDILNTVMKERP